MDSSILASTEKYLTPEQLDSLKETVSDAELERFFHHLHYNFGDGPVLTFKQIKAFLESGLYASQEIDSLQLYIDIVRMARMLPAEESAPFLDYASICTSAEKLKEVHDELITKHKPTVDDKLAELYAQAVQPYQHMTEVCGDIRVELIATLAELNHEGSFMNHCIATYYNIVINKQYVGFRVINTKNDTRLTLGCIRHDDKLYFNQLKGWGNSPADKDNCLQVIEYCKKHDIAITEHHVHDLMPALM